jgi:hypothetical protein
MNTNFASSGAFSSAIGAWAVATILPLVKGAANITDNNPKIKNVKLCCLAVEALLEKYFPIGGILNKLLPELAIINVSQISRSVLTGLEES